MTRHLLLRLLPILAALTVSSAKENAEGNLRRSRRQLQSTVCSNANTHQKRAELDLFTTDQRLTLTVVYEESFDSGGQVSETTAIVRPFDPATPEVVFSPLAYGFDGHFGGFSQEGRIIDTGGIVELQDGELTSQCHVTDGCYQDVQIDGGITWIPNGPQREESAHYPGLIPDESFTIIDFFVDAELTFRNLTITVEGEVWDGWTLSEARLQDKCLTIGPQ